MAVRVFESTEFRSVGLRAIELSEGSGITAVSACGIRPHSSGVSILPKLQYGFHLIYRSKFMTVWRREEDLCGLGVFWLTRE